MPCDGKLRTAKRYYDIECGFENSLIEIPKRRGRYSDLSDSFLRRTRGVPEDLQKSFTLGEDLNTLFVVKILRKFS